MSEARDELARVLWLADGYDLDADPFSRTAAEVRPGYEAMADAVIKQWLPSVIHSEAGATSAEALRWAATHESLCLNWIFDLLMQLADVLEGKA